MLWRNPRRRVINSVLTATSKHNAAITAFLHQLSQDPNAFIAELSRLSSSQFTELLLVDEVRQQLVDAVLASIDIVPASLLAALCTTLSQQADTSDARDYLAKVLEQCLKSMRFREGQFQFYKSLFSIKKLYTPILDKILIDEIRLLRSQDILGIIVTHDLLPEPVKHAARKRIQELAQEETEYMKDDEVYSRGAYCTGCGGC